jgi:hypothetical protein
MRLSIAAWPYLFEPLSRSHKYGNIPNEKEKRMNRTKKYLSVSVVLILTAAIVAAIFAKPVVAQVRAALVRDIDTPALAPFRASVDFSLGALNDQRLLTTVPAGKRLVIEYISYWSYGPTTDQLVFGTLRSGEFGPFEQMIQINPPHASAASTLFIQDASLPVKVYFEAGEEVWVSVSHNTNGARQFQMIANGYYVTP